MIFICPHAINQIDFAISKNIAFFIRNQENVDFSFFWVSCTVRKCNYQYLTKKLRIGSLFKMSRYYHAQYILWSTSSPISSNCPRQEKKLDFQRFFFFPSDIDPKHFRQATFYSLFFFPPTSLRNPCRDPSTIEYTEHGLVWKVNAKLFQD